MYKRKLDNKTLDTIARRLIDGDSVPASEIDKIIANPHLFSQVIARMGAGRQAPSPEPTRVDAVMFFARRNAIAFACAALLLIGAIGVTGLLTSQNAPSTTQGFQVPGAIPDSARPETPLSHYANGLLAGRALASESVVTAAKTAVRKPKRHREPEGEFYAVSFAGDADESGGRIIRVDLPRSSLFALGVNIPLENDAEVVKADLLIGSDGTTRAIRVVK